MYDVSSSNADTFDFTASDGTKVDFVKITSKGNIQVRFPDGHELADGQDNGRIFRPDGSHYKDEYDLTVSATRRPVAAAPAAPASNVTPMPTPAPIKADPFAGIETDDLDGSLVLIRGKAFRLEAYEDFDNIVVLAA